jgi:hypothetical protein
VPVAADSVRFIQLISRMPSSPTAVASPPGARGRRRALCTPRTSALVAVNVPPDNVALAAAGHMAIELDGSRRELGTPAAESLYLQK